MSDFTGRGGATLVHPGYVPGNWYCPVLAKLAVGGGMVANRVNLMPFTLSKPIKVSALGCRITTLAAGGNCQLAIYAHNAATGKPTGPALCSTGNITEAAVGIVSGAVGAAVTIGPGTYWMAANQDNTTAVHETIDVSDPVASYLVGSATLANINSGAGLAHLFLFTAQAFGAWPDLTAAAFTEATAQNNAVVFLKAA